MVSEIGIWERVFSGGDYAFLTVLQLYNSDNILIYKSVWKLAIQISVIEILLYCPIDDSLLNKVNHHDIKTALRKSAPFPIQSKLESWVNEILRILLKRRRKNGREKIAFRNVPS